MEPERFSCRPVRGLGLSRRRPRSWSESATGFTGATKRKAIAFFLRACEEAEIPLSPNFQRRNPRRPASASPNRRRVADRAEGSAKVNAAETDHRGRYLSILLDRIEAGESDPDLLDRVERLLGVTR